MAIQTDWSRRTALADWLTTNGIDPHDVAADGDLTIIDTEQGRVIRCEVFARSAEGAVQLDERGENIAVKMVTLPLKVEPPEWFEPYEKPTREQLLTAADRVRALHPRNENTGECEYCSFRDYPTYAVPHPCDTVRALDGQEQPGA
jgi:hypothetical protein